MNFLYDSDETEIRLPFYRSFSTFQNRYIFIHGHGMGKIGDVNSFVL